MDSIIQEFREFFLRNVQVISGTKADKETNFPIKYQVGSSQVFNRFLKDNFPSENVFSKLFNSITFKLNLEDTATSKNQGLVRLASNSEVINHTNNTNTDFSNVVQPGQLYDVDNQLITAGSNPDVIISTSTNNGITVQTVTRWINANLNRKVFVVTKGNIFTTYKALITQSSTSAPSTTILENNLGSIVWTRNNTGIYFGTLTGAFPLNKTFFIIVNNQVNQNLVIRNAGTNSIIIIDTYDDTWTLQDGLLSNTPIEILVYS